MRAPVFLSSVFLSTLLALPAAAQTSPTDAPIEASTVGGASAVSILACAPGDTVGGASVADDCVLQVRVPAGLGIAGVRLNNVIKRAPVPQAPMPFSGTPRPTVIAVGAESLIDPGFSTQPGELATFFVARPAMLAGHIIMNVEFLREPGLLPVQFNSVQLALVTDKSFPRFICDFNLSLGQPCGITGNDIFP